MKIAFLNLTWKSYIKSISILTIQKTGDYDRSLLCISSFDNKWWVDLFWINIINYN